MAMHPSRQAYIEDDDDDITYDINNVPVDHDYEIPSTSGTSQMASAVLADFTRKRQIAAIAVPTDDGRVRARIRQLGEPMTLFGERPEDRRDRLRVLLYEREQAGGTAAGDVDMQDADDAANDDMQEFFTTGSEQLLAARRYIAQYSLPRAKRRTMYQQRETSIPLQRHVEHRAKLRQDLSTFELQSSQVAGDRPVGIVRIAPDDNTVATGNWGGSIRMLNIRHDLEEKAVLRGHNSHVSGLSWYPGATLPGSTTSENAVNLASGGGEGNVHLWSLTQDTPLATLSGHNERVCRVEFHPSGRHLASASYDTTWRLWDVETTTELLLQEGHSRQCFSVAFNSDGSLLASAGLDSIANLWDLRSGRRILYFDNHIAPIYALSWSVDGHRLMTGSGDGYAKCWDLRAQKEVASIGAHTGGVTDLRWFQGTDGPLDVSQVNGHHTEHDQNMKPRSAGSFFISSGFDKKVNVFSADDWTLCKSLSGHSGNVLSTDVSSDARWIVSSSQDRTVKLWARPDANG